MKTIIYPLVATVLAALPAGAGAPMPPGDGFTVHVVVAGGPHGGSYEARSASPCVETSDGFVVAYMPAVVEKGLRSLRLVIADPGDGTETFTLHLSLAVRNREVARFSLDPRQGVGSGTVRRTQEPTTTIVHVAGTTTEGVGLEVSVRCGADEPVVLAEAADADEEADSSGIDADRFAPRQVVDHRVSLLAGRIALGGPDAVAALHEAIQWSGLGVRNEAGDTILRPVLAPQGFLFDAIDLDLMERSLERRSLMPVGEIALGLAKGSPHIPATTLASALVADLRRHAGGSHPAMRFWARFIAALGGDEGAAFRAPPDSIRLDVVQATFVLQRLRADLLARARMAGGTEGGAGDVRGAQNLKRWNTGTARAEGTSGPSVGLWDVMTPTGPQPRAPNGASCDPNQEQGAAEDWQALAVTTGFSELAARLGGTISSIADFTGKASFVAALSKSIGLFATLQVESSLEGGGLLVRTKSNEEDGEERRVVTTLRLPRTENLKALNCLRPYFNAVGLDFTIPEGGPVADAGVHYQIVEGGVRPRGGPGRRPDLGYLRFKGREDIRPRYTDAAGRASVRIVGLRQAATLPDDAEPVERRGALRVSVQLTRPNLFKDLPSLVGIGFAPITFIPEMIARMERPVETVRFPVRDWSQDLDVRLSVSGIEWGEGSCSAGEDTGSSGTGSDVFLGMIPDSAGLVEAEFIRTSDVPACGGRPRPRRCGKFERCKGIVWDGDERICRVTLRGLQRVRFSMRPDNDAEHGPVLRVQWKLVRPGDAVAEAVGDCLASRWGNEFPPDNEFIVTTKEELVAWYRGFEMGLHERTPRWLGGSEGSVTFKMPRGLRRPYRLQSIEPAVVRHGEPVSYWMLDVR